MPAGPINDTTKLQSMIYGMIVWWLCWHTPIFWLEQLERLHSEDTPCCTMITHTIQQLILDPKSKQSYKFKEFDKTSKFWIKKKKKHYTRHTFWSCLIWCVNMKWIRRVLLKIQSKPDSVHRQTDRQTDGHTRWNQYTLFNFVERGIMKNIRWKPYPQFLTVHDFGKPWLGMTNVLCVANCWTTPYLCDPVGTFSLAEHMI